MAMWSEKREFIFKAVEEMYTDVASRPGAVFHFPTGRLACLFVGYPAAQLDCLPHRRRSRSPASDIHSQPASSAKVTPCSTSGAVPEPTP